MLKISVILTLSTLVLTACASPQSTAKDAENAQHEANEKVAMAGEQNKQKDEEAQSKAQNEKAENNRENVKNSNEAQNAANLKAAEAQTSLANARVEARNENEGKLASLEKTFAELKPQLVRKLSKTDSNAVVAALTSKSEAVRKSIGDLASASSDSLEPIKSTIAQRLIDFDQALNDAKKRI